jgi:AAA+ ATPase superfamily predicted ATPase
MIEGEYLFFIYASRQSGKTTFLHALIDKINLEGKYYTLYRSLSTLRTQQNEDKAGESLC